MANAGWKGLEGELTNVSVEGTRGDVLTADLPVIRRAKLTGNVRLLPLFDLYLMGHSKRDHIVEGAFASRVSRTAGWISAVVLVDGRVAGTWTHVLSKQTLRITVQPFRRLTAGVLAGVRERAAELSASMGAAKSEVDVA